MCCQHVEKGTKIGNIDRIIQRKIKVDRRKLGVVSEIRVKN